MTLVAAYRTLGVPVLLGDFLTTATTGVNQRRSLKKKVHRLQPNLVVGWTGHEVAAQLVLTALRGRYREERAAKQTLEQFLKSFPIADLGACFVELIGWIYDDQPRCFRWRSDWPYEVFYGDYHLAGSGAGLMAKLIGDGAAQGRVPEAIRDDAVEGHAIKETLWDASRLFADEVGRRQNQAAGFGYAYEVLALIGREFHYIDDILFVFVEVGFDGEGRYLSERLHPVLYRSHHESDYAVVQVSTLESTSGRSGHDVHIITPAYSVPHGEPDAILRDVLSRPRPITLEARYFCLYASLIKNANTSTPEPLRPVSVVNAADDASKLFKVEWEADPVNPLAGALTVNLPPLELFERAYRAQVTGEI